MMVTRHQQDHLDAMNLDNAERPSGPTSEGTTKEQIDIDIAAAESSWPDARLFAYEIHEWIEKPNSDLRPDLGKRII